MNDKLVRATLEDSETGLYSIELACGCKHYLRHIGTMVNCDFHCNVAPLFTVSRLEGGASPEPQRS